LKRNNIYSNFNLSDEVKKKLLDEIKNYYYQENGEQIGVIASENLLEFFLNNMGKYIYNQALDDVKAWFENRMENIESDFYSIYKSL
jgi:uncharacterized protein (DUF2164 family)